MEGEDGKEERESMFLTTWHTDITHTQRREREGEWLNAWAGSPNC